MYKKHQFVNSFKAIVGAAQLANLVHRFLYNNAICTADFKEIDHSFVEIHEPHSQQ